MVIRKKMMIGPLIIDGSIMFVIIMCYSFERTAKEKNQSLRETKHRTGTILNFKYWTDSKCLPQKY